MPRASKKAPKKWLEDWNYGVFHTQFQRSLPQNHHPSPVSLCPEFGLLEGFLEPLFQVLHWHHAMMPMMQL